MLLTRVCMSRPNSESRNTLHKSLHLKSEFLRRPRKNASISCPLCADSLQSSDLLAVSIQLFCGRSAGEPEAVFMDSRTPIYDLHTLAVEERPEDHVIMRRLLRSPKLSAVRDASLKSIGGKESEAEAVVRGHSGNGATPEAASISGRGATDSEVGLPPS